MPRPTPCCSLNASLRRSRSAITARHVDLVEGGEHRRGAAAPRPAAARSSRGASTCARALRCASPGCGASAAERQPAAPVGAGGGGGVRRGCVAPRRAARPRLHVLLASRARRRRCPARSRDRRRSLARALRGGRRGAFGGWRLAGPACGRRRAGRPAAARRGAAARASSIDAQHFADLHVLAFLRASMLREHAGLRRADFEVDLVGLELDERLAGRDAVALLLQPRATRASTTDSPSFGNDDVRRHRCSALRPVLARAGLSTTLAIGRRVCRARSACSTSALLIELRATPPSLPTGSRCAAADVAQRTAAADQLLEHAGARTPTRPCSPALPAPRRLPRACG